ncbi:hypothetical protein [Nonomuraea maritima]|uniref:hypothetical protein n=1 Tax=Nonomuraea maritima TaxID=683260 RepID=UPI000B888A12|nr:hypothetical protein [Nonomuraea maritima]
MARPPFTGRPVPARARHPAAAVAGRAAAIAGNDDRPDPTQNEIRIHPGRTPPARRQERSLPAFTPWSDTLERACSAF